MMRGTLLLAVSLATVIGVMAQPLSSPEAEIWENYKRSFNKSYSSEEELHRQQVFLSNLRIVEEHNALYEQGKTTFTLGINKFADLTSAEFRARVNGYRRRSAPSSAQLYSPPADEELPASVDWRSKGAVTDIKNQGNCGSCWAFSATGSLEGQNFLKNGKLVSLSEQNLMDCSEDEGNEGCNGGLMDSSFEYIKENGGIDTESSYPYEAEDGSCRFKKSNIGATLRSYTDVKSGSESALQSAVAKIGPVSVAIDAGNPSFQLYQSGIYYERSCSSSMLDHGVLAVGYGSDSNGDFWIVKNSWGSDWGQSGYIHMSRNKNNNCGIASEASYPNV